MATESLSNDIYVRASHNSVWLNLIPRDTYKSGTGLTQTVYTVERQEPADDEETWNAITLANGSNVGACNSSYTSATFGYNTSTYSPEVFALKGPVLCKDDLIFDHNVAAFLDRYLNSLAIRARRSWENRYQKLYMDFSKKAIADSSFTLEAAGGTFTLDNRLYAAVKRIESYFYDIMPRSRRKNQYCTTVDGPSSLYNHYSWVSLSRRVPTIEVRIHGGTTNAWKVKAWIDICIELKKYFVDAIENVVPHQMNNERFSRNLPTGSLAQKYLLARENAGGSLKKFGF